jgi:hypothetical protein
MFCKRFFTTRPAAGVFPQQKAHYAIVERALARHRNLSAKRNGNVPALDQPKIKLRLDILKRFV